MYRDLTCQHHLVQERYDLRPDIPGLTPIGFEKWATQLIRAHPSEEFQRLQKTVLEMPISNPDDKKERFPKELSRRLFPSTAHREIRDLLQKTIAEHAGVKLPKQGNVDSTKTHVAEPPPRRPENGIDSEPAYVPSDIEREYGYLPNPSIERERKPYSNIPSESAIDDTNPPPSQPQPIERQRKPYRVPGGGGKLYEEDGKASVPNHTQRSNSTTERMRAMPKPTGEGPKPEISHHHRGSVSQRRRQSPAGNDFRRSDGDLRPFPPSTHRAPTLPTGESYEDDPQRHAREADIRRAEYARRQADDDVSSYGGSPSSRTRYDPRFDGSDPRRGTQATDEDYYRGGGRSQGNGYDYSQPYGGSAYR